MADLILPPTALNHLVPSQIRQERVLIPDYLFTSRTAIGTGAVLYGCLIQYGIGTPAMVALPLCTMSLYQNYSRQYRSLQDVTEPFLIATPSPNSLADVFFDWLFVTCTTTLVIGFLNS